MKQTAKSILETEFGTFDIFVYQDDEGKEHVALKKEYDKNPLVRIHSKCATGDIFASLYCDCRSQLHESMRKIQKEGGVLVYLEQEGRGLGLTHKIKAYELQRQGLDTVEADEKIGEGIDDRSYDLAVDILQDLDLSRFRLLTNNPEKVIAMKEAGFEATREEHIVEAKSERGKKYQETKREKLGHLFEVNEQ